MIDYKLIHDSTIFYEEKGFTRIETPWVVGSEINDITRPEDKRPYKLVHNGKIVVGSGEQSFLYLYNKECLPKGKFQTTTPCFRDDAVDFLHSKYFMKNELIQTDIVTWDEVSNIVNYCMDFYSQYFPKSALRMISNEDGYDISLMAHGGGEYGYELGSYGIRRWNNLEWIFATGCAEPRTSKLIKLYGIPHS